MTNIFKCDINDFDIIKLRCLCQVLLFQSVFTAPSWCLTVMYHCLRISCIIYCHVLSYIFICHQLSCIRISVSTKYNIYIYVYVITNKKHQHQHLISSTPIFYLSMPRIKATKVTTATKVRRDVTSAGNWGQSPATLDVTTGSPPGWRMTWPLDGNPL